jgi:hypothetical protein
LKNFFDLLKVGYAIDTPLDPSLTSDDDRHRQGVRYSVKLGDPASPEQERVIYSVPDGQPPDPGSIYRRVCKADHLQSSFSIASLQADELPNLGKERIRWPRS